MERSVIRDKQQAPHRAARRSVLPLPLAGEGWGEGDTGTDLASSRNTDERSDIRELRPAYRCAHAGYAGCQSRLLQPHSPDEAERNPGQRAALGFRFGPSGPRLLVRPTGSI
jgi:hypothetical protein